MAVTRLMTSSRKAMGQVYRGHRGAQRGPHLANERVPVFECDLTSTIVTLLAAWWEGTGGLAPVRALPIFCFDFFWLERVHWGHTYLGPLGVPGARGGCPATAGHLHGLAAACRSTVGKSLFLLCCLRVVPNGLPGFCLWRHRPTFVAARS